MIVMDGYLCFCWSLPISVIGSGWYGLYSLGVLGVPALKNGLIWGCVLGDWLSNVVLHVLSVLDQLIVRLWILQVREVLSIPDGPSVQSETLNLLDVFVAKTGDGRWVVMGAVGAGYVIYWPHQMVDYQKCSWSPGDMTAHNKPSSTTTTTTTTQTA